MAQLHLRRATFLDLDELHEIWMQDHILPFMTFLQLSKEDFKPIFETFLSESEIYVLEEEGKIIATRRIIFRKEPYAHSVEFASFGVHKNYLKQGHGAYLYQYLLNKIRKERPEIKRIEIRQETNNKIALCLAKKMGFKIEVIQPDWSCRLRKTKKYLSKYYIPSRFLAFKLPDEDKINQCASLVKCFAPEIPALNTNHDLLKHSHIQIDSAKNEARFFYKNNELGVCEFKQGVRTFSHIQFWTIKLNPTFNLPAMEVCLRELICNASLQCKKIEIYTHELKIQQLLTALGFSCRGKRVASYKENGVYYDEISCDFSFFNIDDAKELLNNINDDVYSKKNFLLLRLLDKHKETIQQAFNNKKIDKFASLYLQNYVYQNIRDSIAEIN